MAIDAGLYDWIVEALGSMGIVSKRAMMGGATLYLDGTIFAIMADDALWFKADALTDALWDAEGCARFTYAFKGGMTGSMNYRRAPDDVYDDVEAMQHWAEIAVEAGQRVPPKKVKNRTN
jgi:DNA transformation protein and related proteins